jgi:muramidase (phage lysozyme)
VNALPVTWQIPAMGAVAAVVSGGIMLAVKSPDVRSVMFGLLTTAFGLGVAQIVDDREISRFSGSVADHLRKAMSFATEGLFGKGIFGEKDPASIIALIAKLSLLFKSGREFISGKALALATAPTSIATQAATAIEAKRAAASYKELAKTIENAPKDAADRMDRAKDNLNTAIRNLARTKDANGILIGTSSARNIVNNSNVQVSGAAANLQAILARRANDQLEKTREQLANLATTTSDLKAKHEALGKTLEALNKRVSDNKEAFKSGVINTAAGIGGTLGSLYGFNLGNEIADSLTNATGWQKVGVTIATAMIGQGIGAGIGAVVGQAIIGALTMAGAVLMNPFVIGGALAAAAIYGAFLLFKNWNIFENFIIRFHDVLNEFLARLGLLGDGRNQAVINKSNSEIDSRRKAIEIAQAKRDAANTAQDKAYYQSVINELEEANKISRDNTKKAGGIAGGEAFRASIVSDSELNKRYAQSIADKMPQDEVDANLKAWANVKKFFNDLPDLLKAGAEKVMNLIIPSANAATDSSLKPNISTGISVPSIAPTNIKPDLIDPSIKAAKLSRIAEIQKTMNDMFKAIDPADRIKVFLEAITNFEGANFNTNFGGKTFSDMSKHPNEPGQFKLANGKTTSAAGAFQFQRGTWEALAKKNDLPDFKPDSQVIGALDLIKQAGAMADILAGNFSEAASKLGKIWEGLPTSDKFSLNMRAWEDAPKKLSKTIDSIKEGTAKVTTALNSQAVRIEKTVEDTVGDTKDGIQGFIDSLMKSASKSPADFFDSLKKMLAGGLARMGGGAGVSGAKSSTSINEPGQITPVDATANTKVSDRLASLPDAESSIIAINTALTELSIPLLKINSFDKIDPEKVKTLAEAIDNIQSIEKAIVENSGDNQNKIGAIALANLRKNNAAFKAKAKEIIDDLNVGDILGKKVGRSALAEQIGTTFAKGFQEDFGNKVSQVLQGKMKFRDALTSMLDSVTSQIIDNFTKGFVDAFFDRFSIKRMLEDGMAGMAGAGESIAKVGSGSSASPNRVLGTLSGFVSKAWDGITSLFGGSSSDSSVAASTSATGNSSDTPNAASATSNSALVGSVATGAAPGVLGSAVNGSSCCCGGAGENAGKATEGVFTKAWKSLKETLSSAWDGLKGMLGGAWDGLKGMLGGAWDSLSGVFSGLPDMLSGAWDGLTSSLSGVFDGFSGSFSGILGSLSSSLSGIMGGIGGMFSGGGGFGWSSIAMLFAADGGYVSGPGSSRSDSIPAMLSNGEFVVNAAATKKFSPFLNAINTGKIGKFADGGPVGSVLTMPIDTSNRKDMSSSTQMGSMKQEFNINITGDVSRQTRSEIQKMIPQIATGVNIHNYEQGRGRR